MLIAVGISQIAIQVVNSPQIKRPLFLDIEYPVLELLSSPKAYKIALGLWKSIVLTIIPVIPIVIVCCLIHRLAYRVLLCEHCASFWSALIVSATVFHFGFAISILIGGLALFLVTVNNLIESYIK
jgi:hypothetical protein